MAHKVVITQSTAGRSGPPQTMLDVLEEAGIDRDIPITHWGWYYPVSNYIETEPVKQTSINAVMRGITQLIKAYEDKHNGGEQFPTKYYFKTCQHCSFMPICDAAQSEVW